MSEHRGGKGVIVCGLPCERFNGSLEGESYINSCHAVLICQRSRSGGKTAGAIGSQKCKRKVEEKEHWDHEKRALIGSVGDQITQFCEPFTKTGRKELFVISEERDGGRSES
jgi:hypothetical protein